MLPLIVVVSASAGEVFVIEQTFPSIYSFDAREMTQIFLSNAVSVRGNSLVSGLVGADYDPATDTLYAVGEGREDTIFAKTPGEFTWDEAGSHAVTTLSGLAYDPNVGLLGFSDHAWGLLPAPVVDLGAAVPAVSSDFEEDQGISLLVQNGTGDVYGYVPGLTPWWLATLPSDGLPLYTAAGYDADLKIFWVAGYGTEYVEDLLWRRVDGYDPQTWARVASVRLLAGQAMAGSRDTVLVPEPALLVTGDCPGTVYVTVADATPGGEVMVVSGTTAGARTAPSGPCAGTAVDLADPRVRGRLPVGSSGLASTSFVAGPQACGLQLQALDVSTCSTTEVRVVETSRVMPDVPPP